MIPPLVSPAENLVIITVINHQGREGVKRKLPSSFLLLHLTFTCTYSQAISSQSTRGGMGGSYHIIL